MARVLAQCQHRDWLSAVWFPVYILSTAGLTASCVIRGLRIGSVHPGAGAGVLLNVLSIRLPYKWYIDI